MTDSELIAGLIAKLNRTKERNHILRSTLNYYTGFNYKRNHRDEVILNDEGEKAHDALLKDLAIGVEDNDFDISFASDILDGRIDAPDPIRKLLRANKNVLQALETLRRVNEAN